jgi:sugar/nucleoside kinase (ribokinase family)
VSDMVVKRQARSVATREAPSMAAERETPTMGTNRGTSSIAAERGTRSIAAEHESGPSMATESGARGAATRGAHKSAPKRHADPVGLAIRRPDHDPLGAIRTPGDPEVDVFLSGPVFLDIIFTGLEAPPALGAEIWTEGMGSSPGGAANLATALSRLGLRTTLAAAFGEDVYGDFCWDTLANQEGVDLSTSRRFPGWHSPVTVSLAYNRDRSMITHGHEPPVPVDTLIDKPPRARACAVQITSEPAEWVEQARSEGSLIFADAAWDPTQAWAADVLRQLEFCHAFMPNGVEACHYTRTETPRQALHKLADAVPIAVVTCGPGGVLAIDSETGEEAHVPALAVEALDPTGAGDVFGAAFILGTLSQWPLPHRLRFANLCAGLSVQHFGGSLSAPGWADVAAWWQPVRSSPGDRTLAEDYAFLEAILPSTSCAAVHRATATIGFRAPA